MSTAAIEVLSSLSETFQSAQAVIKLHDYGYKDFFPRLLSTLTQTIITLLPFSNSTNPRIDRMVNMKISLSHVFLLFVCTCTFELLQSTLFLQQMSSLLLCMLEWCLRVPDSHSSRVIRDPQIAALQRVPHVAFSCCRARGLPAKP